MYKDTYGYAADAQERAAICRAIHRHDFHNVVGDAYNEVLKDAEIILLKIPL
ncbi:MAG: hypothetical protein LBS21_10620 [Clostridiales bacterium]|jgi:hypothetical protein|nr:hypothetical protein [Clostridiales bacterium]